VSPLLAAAAAPHGGNAELQAGMVELEISPAASPDRLVVGGPVMSGLIRRRFGEVSG
jgi:hypothetical protein